MIPKAYGYKYLLLYVVLLHFMHGIDVLMKQIRGWKCFVSLIKYNTRRFQTIYL